MASSRALGTALRGREFSGAALIPDGTVLISGGQLPGIGNGDPTAEVYTPDPGTFALTVNMHAGRHSHTATLLPDGTVLVAGGYSGYPEPTGSSEVYTPAVLVAAPQLFSLPPDGKGQGAMALRLARYRSWRKD